jgi:hypothetical protein
VDAAAAGVPGDRLGDRSVAELGEGSALGGVALADVVGEGGDEPVAPVEERVEGTPGPTAAS